MKNWEERATVGSFLVLTLVVVLAVYLSGSTKPKDVQTVADSNIVEDTTESSTSDPVPTQTKVAPSSPSCIAKFDEFQQRTEATQDFYTQKATQEGTPESMVVQIDRSSFVIGYSPSLKACVGGYRTIQGDYELYSTGTRGWINEESYYVVNVDTNATLHSYSDVTEKIFNSDIQKSRDDMDSAGVHSDIALTMQANDAARKKWRDELNNLTNGQITIPL